MPRQTAGAQKQRILEHFLGGRTLTHLEALGVYGAFRLAARVHTLKQEGHDIRTTLRRDPNGKTYAEYRLVSRDRRGDVKKVA